MMEAKLKREINYEQKEKTQEKRHKESNKHTSCGDKR